MSSYRIHPHQISNPLSIGMGLLALSGGIYGLATPFTWGPAAFGLPITAQNSQALPFASFAAARNLGSGITLLTLLSLGQRKAVGALLMCGVVTAVTDGWICFKFGAPEKTAMGHVGMGALAGLLGARTTNRSHSAIECQASSILADKIKSFNQPAATTAASSTMNTSRALRSVPSPISTYICRPCLRRHLHITRRLRDDSEPKAPNPESSKSTSSASKTEPSPETQEIITSRPSKSKRLTKQKTPKFTRRELEQWRKRGNTGVPPSWFSAYTSEDWETLKQTYTPAQIEAIKAAEEAVSTKDLATQSKFRMNDPWAITYSDDFSTHHGVLDKRVQPPESTNYDPKLRFKTEDEIKRDFGEFVANLPHDETEAGIAYHRFMDNQRLMVGKEAAERDPITSLAPEIPKGIEGLAETATKKVEGEEVAPAEKRLMKQTGYSMKFIRSLRSKVLVSHRVVNQTRLGKIQSIYVLTVVGNGKGLVGIGEGKSADGRDARQQSLHAAVRAMVPVERYEKRTIFGDVKGKMGATELELMNRPPGFGIRCMHLIHEICRCAGINDLAARVTRARNPMNVVKATMQALTSQRTPDEMARGLGRKLVDVRKVYYGGSENLAGRPML